MTPLQHLRLLCRALSPAAISDTDELKRLLSAESPWPELVRLAGEGLVTPSLAGALQRQELFRQIPADAQTYLAGIQQLNAERNAEFADELQRVTAWLNAGGIEPVLLKGTAYLAGEAYPGSADRVVGDLDLLVPAGQIEQAVRVIQRDEYRMAEGYDDSFLQKHHHAAPVLHQSRPVAVELHRDLCREELRGLLPTREYLEGSTAIEWRGARLRLPSATDRIMHNFVHAQLQDRGYQHRHLHLRALHEFACLRQAMGDAIDWRALDLRLAKAGAVKARAAWLNWLQAAEDLFGQAPPAEFKPGRHAKWRHWQALKAMTSPPINRLVQLANRRSEFNSRFLNFLFS